MIPIIGGKADGHKVPAKVPRLDLDGEAYMLVSFRDSSGEHYFYQLAGFLSAGRNEAGRSEEGLPGKTGKMKERGIIMSGDNPKLILDGRKTQTRRIMRKQPIFYKPFGAFALMNPQKGYVAMGVACDDILRFCPYGVAGDRLWVRENWRTRLEWNNCAPSGLPISRTATGGDVTDRDDWPWLREQFIHYAVAPDDNGTLHGRLRPSIHMCQWMARITLEITRVRGERVQDISADDVIDEGLDEPDFWDEATNSTGRFLREDEPREAYRAIWDSLHGKGAWERNDWVWVLDFKRV